MPRDYVPGKDVDFFFFVATGANFGAERQSSDTVFARTVWPKQGNSEGL